MDDQNTDYYALLEVASDASSKQIRTAYRQKSLKVHPDRNPDNPQAAHLFHELTLAHEILIDPGKRDSYDKIYKARQARAERFKSLDNKRKNLAEDLVAREEAYKKARVEERQKERQEKMELERLKEEGERLRKAREEKIDAQAKELKEEQKKRHAQAAQRENEPGLLDTTVRLKWPRKQFPALEVDSEAITSLLGKLGIAPSAIDSVAISSKMATNPKLKNATAMVALKSLTAAVKVVESSNSAALTAIEATWASGQEPEMVRAARERESSSTEGVPASSSSSSSKQEQSAAPPPPSPPSMSTLNEDSILEQLRARERERERMEEEIRRQDAEDAAAES